MRGRILLWALGLGAVVWVFGRHYRFFDMAIYQGAIRWWLAGGDLYGYQAPVRGNLGFTYPPFAALVLSPVALVPVAVAGWTAVVASVAALGAGMRALLGVRRLMPLIVVAALATEPVRQTLGLGQVNLILFGIVALDLACKGSRWTGVGVGLATAIKLTPGLFIVYLLVTRQWRAALTATVTCAAVTAGAALIAPRETVQYFGGLLWETGRVGVADAAANQSVTGMLARLDAAEWTTVVSIVVLVTGLRRATQAYERGDVVAALTLVGLTANLITPVAWTHHLVFLPVALVLLARSGRRRDLAFAGGGYLICVVAPIWWATDVVGANAFVLLMLALLAWLPIGGPAGGSIPDDRHRRDGGDRHEAQRQPGRGQPPVPYPVARDRLVLRQRDRAGEQRQQRDQGGGHLSTLACPRGRPLRFGGNPRYRITAGARSYVAVAGRWRTL